MACKQYDPSVEREWLPIERIQLCVVCTLAEAMKSCKQGYACPFSIGIQVRAIHLRTLDLQENVVELERYWQTLPKAWWEAYNDYLCSWSNAS
jgi:hypothetical protein